jgi:hypothetical protein
MQPWRSSPSSSFGLDVEMPTLTIPCACTCNWVVVQPGPGMACISKLKQANNGCPCRHKAAAPAIEVSVRG